MPVDRRERRLLWAAAAVSLAAIIAYSQTLSLAWDEGFHLLAAQLILRGKRPYLDFLHPQTPLYAYFNAFIMRIFGESWRVVHLVSSLALVGAALLTATYVIERVEDRSWRLAGALCAFILVALNSTSLWYGTIAQPYAVCLLLVVLAFRSAICAAERDSALDSAVAGLCAGAAAACSLLTAPFVPVLLFWIWMYGAKRWRKAVAFVGGAVAPFVPLAVLFVQGPRQVLFGVFQYHALYRDADWPGAGKQNLDVATGWMNNYEAFLLICLASLGLSFVLGRANWELARKREFLLCAWLIAAESAYLLIPRPTFGRYYLFVVPFLSILSAMGLYALAPVLGGVRFAWRYPAALAAVMLAAFAKYSVDTWSDYRWSNLTPVAQKVEEVTPPGAELYADEPIYFLLHRVPPSGMEYMDSHKLELPDDVAAALHVIPTAKLDQQVAAGKFTTIEICNNPDRVEALGLPGRYTQSADISDCKIFWDWR